MNPEWRVNAWAVKCMTCIPVCTGAFCGFVHVAGVNWLSAFVMFQLILWHPRFCMAFEVFKHDAATLHAFSASCSGTLSVRLVLQAGNAGVNTCDGCKRCFARLFLFLFCYVTCKLDDATTRCCE